MRKVWSFSSLRPHGRPPAVTPGAHSPTKAWPARIAPNQPFTDVKTLEYDHHGYALHLTVADLTADGDLFEAEDQRQWGDASYKLYVRPLRKEWPYTVPEGRRVGALGV